MTRRFLAASSILCLSSVVANGQSLQESLEDIDVDQRWEYNDWPAARAAAAKSGKPILALFR